MKDQHSVEPILNNIKIDKGGQMYEEEISFCCGSDIEDEEAEGITVRRCVGCGQILEELEDDDPSYNGVEEVWMT